MKRLFGVLLAIALFTWATPVFAATPDISSFTSNTLAIITFISAAAAVLFLIKGGYGYITSTGKPEVLEEAKKTIKNAVVGLVIVLAAGTIVSLFRNSLTSATPSGSTAAIALSQIESVKPSEGLTQVLIDAVSGFMQNIVQSATKPLVDGIMSFLTTTPSVLGNSVIVNFWLVSLGIVDSLFIVVVALLGLNFMSASTFGFEETELKVLLPRIGLAFLGANISLFLADYVILTCNVLVTAVLNATGGLNQAWLVNAITLPNVLNGSVPIITLIFLALFLMIAIVLLLMYISRLIIISLGAVLSPFIFLLWTLPKFSDIAEMAIKTYVVSVFMIFVHVVTIQLAASYLVLPGQTNNSLLSIAVAIGLFFMLIKIPSVMMQMVLFTSSSGAVKKIGSQVMNVMTANHSSTQTRASSVESAKVKVPRKVVSI
ncbi:MAG TPA: pilin [Candidatus Wunengus sp. YC60]|uniref:pilin n=1 Tax=Candidatus Wunengus sp. YC60 TaxID=3367697 RepID=UPI00402714C1